MSSGGSSSTTGSAAAGKITTVTHSWSGTDGKYKANGQLKFNAYTMSRSEKVRTKSAKNYKGYLSDGSVSGLTWTSNDDLALLSKLATAAQGHDFSLGIAIAERKQTMDLVLSTIKTLATALHATKHGDFSRAARALGIRPKAKGWTTRRNTVGQSLDLMSSRWLELQYGWKPLLSDVEESAKAYAAITASHQREEYVRVHSFRSVSCEASASPTLYSLTGHGEIRGSMILRIGETIPTARTLGLQNVAGIAWEILPWSFVFDWFIPIGTYLDVLDILPTLTGDWCKTVSTNGNINGMATPVKGRPSGSPYDVYDYTFVTSTAVRVTRTVGQGFPASSIPLPSVKRVDQSLSSMHIANAIALAIQRLKK